MRTSGFKNSLLKALGGDILERLGLRPVQFELKHEIETPGDPIDHLYFLGASGYLVGTGFMLSPPQWK